MAEIKERALKVLQGLSQMTEPTRPAEIGNMVGETPLNVGRDLSELLKADLAEKTDEAQNLWSVTEKGAEYLSNLDIESLSQPSVTVTRTASVTEIPLEKMAETVPSQSDLFRAEGERLGIGKGIRTISQLFTREKLVEKPDKKKKLYIINENGMQFLENPAEGPPKVSPREPLKEPPKGTRKGPLKEPPKDEPSEEPPEGTTEIVPSQSDLFRSIDERLSIAVGRGGERKGSERGKEKETRRKTVPLQSDIFESIENGDGYSHRSQ